MFSISLIGRSDVIHCFTPDCDDVIALVSHLLTGLTQRSTTAVAIEDYSGEVSNFQLSKSRDFLKTFSRIQPRLATNSICKSVTPSTSIRLRWEWRHPHSTRKLLRHMQVATPEHSKWVAFQARKSMFYQLWATSTSA